MDAVTSIVGLVVVLAPAAWGLAQLMSNDGGFRGTFLQLNPDLGWPHGVQEDDDFHWRWDRKSESRLGQRSSGVAGPPVRPVEAATLRLAMPQQLSDSTDGIGEIVDWDVTPIPVTRVERRH